MCQAKLAASLVFRSLFGLRFRWPLRCSLRLVLGKISLTGRPSRGLSFPSRVLRPRAVRRKDSRQSGELSPLRFFPLQRVPEDGQPHTPGHSSSRVKVPPQRLSRSRGLDPPVLCRPCFVPVPLMGFHPSRPFPLAEPYVLSNAVPLLLFDPRIQLQGFAPCRRPCSR